MKKLVSVAAVLVGMMVSVAHADPVVCGLQAELTGKSVHIGLGQSKAKGTGTLSCVNHQGEKTSFPIEVRVKGYGVGLGYSKETYKVLATNIGLANDPSDIFGKYGVVKASAFVGEIGGEASVGLTVQNEALAFSLAIVGKKGKGLSAAVDLAKLEILPLQ